MLACNFSLSSFLSFIFTPFAHFRLLPTLTFSWLHQVGMMKLLSRLIQNGWFKICPRNPNGRFWMNTITWTLCGARVLTRTCTPQSSPSWTLPMPSRYPLACVCAVFQAISREWRGWFLWFLQSGQPIATVSSPMSLGIPTIAVGLLCGSVAAVAIVGALFFARRRQIPAIATLRSTKSGSPSDLVAALLVVESNGMSKVQVSA